MADTQRTRSALQTLLADNVIGAISPQDVRDFLVTVMQPEFVNANDYWNEPLPDQITTNSITRGWHWYSQVISEACSMADILFLNSKNAWSLANASQYSKNTVLGAAADSYAEDATDGQLLKRGMVYHSVVALIDRMTGQIGSPLFLFSATDGSISITNVDGWSRVVGYVLPAGVGSVQTKGKWYFNSDGWSVSGV